MNQLTELVDLPDPSVQPLVHPLDLREARGLFRKAWLIGALTSPAMGLCLAAVVWFATRSYLVPLIAGAAHVGFGALASRAFADRAWAFIPRKRQDRRRLLPVAWELASALGLAAALSLALLLVADRLAQPDVPLGIREFTVGAAIAIVPLVLVDFAVKLRRDFRHHGRRAMFTAPAVLAVIAAAGALLDASSGVNLTSTALWGAATMLVVGAGVGVWTFGQRSGAERS